MAFGIIGAVAGIVSCGGGGGGSTSSGPTVLGPVTGPIKTKAQLGQAFFFDTTLSNPTGESCSTCHSPSKAFTDPRPGPTSEGVIPGLFGFRNAPSISYMAYSPDFGFSVQQRAYIGGQFWDGRATDLPSQAKVPLLNPTEMNNTSVASLVAKVQSGKFANALKQLYGATIFSDPTNAFNAIVDAISQFERIPAVSPFTSKFDAFLQGKAQLTASEINGMALFNGKAACAECHVSSPQPDGNPPLFTQFCYDNIGLPKNTSNPYYTIPSKFNPAGANFVDLGLQGTTSDASTAGFFMTPSLRNVAVTGPYFHNGIFNTLAEVVNFYNTRDTGNFGTPEVPATVDRSVLIGHLLLTAQEQLDLISFLGTLTDGYMKSP